MYFVVLGFIIPKIRCIGWLYYTKIVFEKWKSACFKCTYGLPVNDYRVAILIVPYC